MLDIIREKPIATKDEDKLNRDKFAKNLAEKINNYSDESSLTVGLIGPWGCGKSSIINMMEEEIDKDKIKVIEFNPWYFSSRKKLICDFFELLSEEIKLNDGNKKVEKLSSDLKKYANVLEPIKFIPGYGMFYELIKSVANSSSDLLKKSDEINLSQIKDNINRGLCDYDKKIVVIIDEIDRLEDDEIKEIFQLVRALGDFDNIVYLLSFDKKRVTKVFEEGEKYLEKIINIPIYVPEISQSLINNIFIDSLGEIFGDDENINNKYWKKIYEDIFENNFKNLREVTRYLNVVKFNKSYIIKELNVVDYLVITFIKMFETDFYEYMCNNYKLLDISKKDIDEKKLNIKVKTNISPRQVIENLFINDPFIGSHGIRAINNKRYFSTYFNDILSEDAFSSVEIQKIVSIKEENSLKGYFNSFNNDELLKIYNNLEEIILFLNDSKHSSILFKELLCDVKRFDKNAENFKYIDQEKIFEKLRKFNCKSFSKNDLIFIANNLEIDSKYNIKYFIKFVHDMINEINLEEFQNIILKKVENYIYKNYHYGEYKELKKIGVNTEKYIYEIIKTDEGLIKYLNSVQILADYGAHEIYDDLGEVYDVEEYEYYEIVESDISNFINYELVKKRVKKLKKSVLEENKQLIREFLNPVSESTLERAEKEQEQFMLDNL